MTVVLLAEAAIAFGGLITLTGFSGALSTRLPVFRGIRVERLFERALLVVLANRLANVSNCLGSTDSPWPLVALPRPRLERRSEDGEGVIDLLASLERLVGERVGEGEADLEGFPSTSRTGLG